MFDSSVCGKEMHGRNPRIDGISPCREEVHTDLELMMLRFVRVEGRSARTRVGKKHDLVRMKRRKTCHKV